MLYNNKTIRKRETTECFNSTFSKMSVETYF